MSDDRAPIYQEGDTYVFRASAVGMSLKAMVALLMGFDPAPPTDKMREAFEAGHRLEPEILARVGASPSQQQVELKVHDNAVIRGHIDGVKDGHIVEVKALGDSLYQAFVNGTLFDKVPGYADQISVYMEATGKPAYYVVGHKQDGKVDGLMTKELVAPPTDIRLIKVKILKAISLAEQGELPTECDCNGWMCPIYYLHEDADRVQVDDIHLDTLAAVYKDAQQREKVAATAKKEAGAKLMDALVKLEADKVESNRYKITRVTQTRTQLDKEKLAAVVDLKDFETEYQYHYIKLTERRVGA